jgi:prepilin-type N-terminal cleavage/methylation domain-containing protein
MGHGRRPHGFSLIEAMVVVSIVGILAVLATVGYRRWVRTAYLSEAQDMVANIRTAQEAFRAENGGYLNVSAGLGPTNDYPAETPGKFKTTWGGACTRCNTGVSWAALNVQPNAPLAFGYSVIASNSAPPAVNETVNGVNLDVSAMGTGGTPWYFIEADGDVDGNSVFTRVFGMSGTNQIFVDNEGE